MKMNRRQFHQTLTAMLPAATLAQAPPLLAQRPEASSHTKGKTEMQIVDKLMWFSMAVTDMNKAKAFYADKLGLKVASDYRRDDHNWWVSLTLPEGGASLTLTTSHENMKPGTMKLYLASSDLAAAHRELGAKGVAAGEIKNDLYGPGSGVKWLPLADPDGNQVMIVQS